MNLPKNKGDRDMWSILIIILLIIIIIALIFSLIRQLKKVDVYEIKLQEYYDIMNQITNWIKIALDKLHDIDRKQIFEGDDDVGWFFQTLKYQFTELNNKIASIFGENTNEEEKGEEK